MIRVLANRHIPASMATVPIAHGAVMAGLAVLRNHAMPTTHVSAGTATILGPRQRSEHILLPFFINFLLSSLRRIGLSIFKSTILC